ncbi:MAG: M48 family metallopeptidase [Firmicutes bacterium]|nr:M48 family metallopeptidase [Bacillota bacterium]
MSIDRENWDVELIRSDRKTISVEITRNCGVRVRAPRAMKQAEIDAFLLSRKDWIEKHLDRVRREMAETPQYEVLTTNEMRGLVSSALKDIPQRVEHFAPIVGVDYGRITIRNQRSRWGSCSAKGNLNFNCLMMLMPEEIRDYIVVHELCHRLVMNHSAAFWHQVERVLPEYKKCRKWLREHGDSIMRRMTG